VSLIIIKAVLVVGLVPIVLSFWLKRADDMKPKPWAARWTYANWAFWLLLIGIAVVASLEVWSYRESQPRTGEEVALTVLPLAAYEQEIDATTQRPADWPARRQELVRKFEFAEYAYAKHDYAKAAQALQELESGQDSLGSLLRVNSYVVGNNLGCIYFKLQRNRGFTAIQWFFTARARAATAMSHNQTVEQNIRVLDDLVNRLD
jgi:hypothetical protein